MITRQMPTKAINVRSLNVNENEYSPEMANKDV